MRVQVYPESAVSDGFKRDLRNNFPQALIIFHPVYETWQLYECRNQEWNAERLFNAICYDHVHRSRTASSPYANREEWWHWRGAPTIINDGLPMPPGDWLLELLGNTDLYRYPGGIKQWYKDREALYFKRLEDRRRNLHETHKSVAQEGFYRHARDFSRGDPLAGKRHWVHTVPANLR